VFDLESRIIRLGIIFLSIYAFLLSISLIGSAFKLFGSDFAQTIMQTAANPLVALFIGLLATSVMQSSSSTTSIIVGMVAGGFIPLSMAIPMVMGANIGTTVTNTLVSIGHITSKKEFQLAFAGATVHDFFNVLAVIILFPIELLFHPIEYSAVFLTDLFSGAGGLQFISPLKMIIQPANELLVSLLGSNSFAILLIALLLLFLSLKTITSNIKRLVASKAETLLDVYLFNSALTAFIFGAIFTAIVQSSSVTTSILIPLIGAGVLTLRKAFPYMLGANIGTTITAFLAALAIGTPAAIAVSISHFVFNIFGIGIIYPFRDLPIRLAQGLGNLAAYSKRYALIYLSGCFFVIPIILIFIINGG
jgi:sodium-dependent phosphate cotransporter